MWESFLDFLFPQEGCCICRKPGRYSRRQPWCQDCANKMVELQCSDSTCDKCGKYLQECQTLCVDCRNNPPRFDIARAVGPYDDPYRITTKVLKFMGRKHLAYQMGHLMVKKIKEEPRFGKIDLIVPVPISPKGLQRRGFNQTDLLAQQISKELGIRMDSTVIHRVKETPSQTELSREEREKNLLCAFEINEPERVANQEILLVDDVYTTGSTGRECTRTLLDAGAVRVCIITWATGRGF